MHRSRVISIVVTLALLGSLAAPLASAHETYTAGDGRFELVIGEQNEPVYTYKWTNLDLIVRTASDDGGGGGQPVEDAHLTLDATLIAPDSSTLNLPLEPQFGEVGRYAFEEGYLLTRPGQYQLRLEGQINGTDINGTFDMPGPRTSWSDRSFPDPGVPGIVQMDDDIQALEDDNERLRDRVDALEQQVDALQAEANTIPGFGALAALAAVGIAFLVGRRSGV